METLSLSLPFSPFPCLPCCCQCRFKRYIAKQKNSKTEEIVPLWRQSAFPTTCLLSFPFSFDEASHKSQDSYFLSFFFTLIFSFFKDYKKRPRSHLPFLLFFILPFILFCFILSFFTMIFSFFKDYNKNLTFRSYFLFQFSREPAVMTADLTHGLLSFLFSFDAANSRSHGSFVLSFSL